MGQKGFQAGHPKFGGRVAGKPSLKKIRTMEVRQTYIDNDCNPILELIKVARSKTPVPEHKIKALTELCKYFAPRLTTQNVNHKIESNVHVETLQHLAMTDDAVFLAMETLSLKMSEIQMKASGAIIDVTPAFPEALPAIEGMFDEGSPSDEI
jgi:hypothetical protein